jgi:hypothetical protein
VFERNWVELKYIDILTYHVGSVDAPSTRGIFHWVQTLNMEASDIPSDDDDVDNDNNNNNNNNNNKFYK